MTDAELPPPNCPKCGKPLQGRQDDGVGTIYHCAHDGLFWIDGKAYLRDGRTLRRDPNSPRLSD